MIYNAITIDSNVIIGNNFNFSNSLLKHLDQFQNTPVKFVISQIVLREVYKRFIRGGLDHHKKLMSVLNGSDKYFDISENDISSIRSNYFPVDEFEKDLHIRLDGEFLTLGAEIISISDTITTNDINNILDLYFQEKVPFNTKKKEFPDAIALISLENWCRKNNKRILAVSKDKDWINYCAESLCIDCIDDLGKALSKFQPGDNARNLEKELNSILQEAPLEKMPWPNFGQELQDRLHGLNFSGDADSHLVVEIEDIELLNINEISFNNVVAILTQTESVVFQVGISVDADFSANGYFYIRDHEGDMFYGGNTLETTTSFDINISLEFSGAVIEKVGDLTLTTLNVINRFIILNFGYSEPFQEPDEYYDELHERSR